jgi:hypothetical protein
VRISVTGGDTVRIKAKASDPDKGDKVSLNWSSGSRFNVPLIMNGDSLVRYLSRDAVYSDTIVLRALSLTKIDECRIVVNVNNRRPIIDSIRAGSVSYINPDSISVTLNTGDSVLFRVFARDRDVKDTLVYRLTGGTRSTPKPVFSGTTLRYTAADSLYKDTLVVRTSDGRSEDVCRIFIAVANCRPRVDSVTINNAVYRLPDTIVFHGTATDTLSLKIFASDRDAKDSISYLWSDGAKAQVKLYSCRNTAEYPVPGLLYRDTIWVRVQDRATEKLCPIILIIDNHKPEIDSITITNLYYPHSYYYYYYYSVHYTGNEALYPYYASGGDTLLINVYAHDIDAGDTILSIWYNEHFLHNRSIDPFFYICLKANYSDTLWFSAADARNARAREKIVINVSNY